MSDTHSVIKHRRQQDALWRCAVAVVLAIAFFAYFNAASSHLRLGAGPDYASHNDVSRFIQQHGRLPLLPADEAELYFSVYGGTRALRPPLTYLVSASLAQNNPATRDDRLRSYRTGANLLGALTVAIAFLGVAIWSGRLLFGLVGAAIVGFWPQFSFIATYNNDDIGAVFSATLLIYTLIRLWRFGPGRWGGITLGIAGGLVILSKPTAWLLLPFTALVMASLAIIWGFKATSRTTLIALAVAAMVGGWWLAFNAWHYGINDIFLQQITAEMAEKHNRFDDDKVFGYAARGIGAKLLIAGNHDDFMLKTWIASIGNLDWLRLRLGRVHYLWFTVVLALALIGPLLLTLAAFVARRNRPVSLQDNPVHGITPVMANLSPVRDSWLAWLLLGTVVFQFAMYVVANLYNDIQIQGKYLLPMLLPTVVLVSTSLIVLSAALQWFTGSNLIPSGMKHPGRLAIVVPLAVITITAWTHYDAVQRYVLPFYQPAIYQPELRKLHLQSIREVELTPQVFARHNGIADMKMTEQGLKLTLTGHDPWLEFNTTVCNPDASRRPIRGNILARLRVLTERQDKLAIYWDDGSGFNEGPAKNQIRFDQNSGPLYLWMGMKHCQRLRIDPGHSAGEITIQSFELIDVTIEPEYDPPFGR